MSSEQDPQKSLEMRVAAIEDKLAQATVTAEEMRAYQKVAALAAGAVGSSPLTFTCSIVITVNPNPITIGPHPCAVFTPQAASRPQGGGEGFGGLGR